jgi:hypothetical protein
MDGDKTRKHQQKPKPLVPPPFPHNNNTTKNAIRTN